MHYSSPWQIKVESRDKKIQLAALKDSRAITQKRIKKYVTNKPQTKQSTAKHIQTSKKGHNHI